MDWAFYCDCKDLFWIFLADAHNKRPKLLGRRIKTLYLDISSQNTIHENILKLYVYIFNCYLNKDHSTSCKNNDNHANDQGNVILKMNIHLWNNSNFNYFLFIEKGKCVSHQLCLPLLIFLLFFLQLFCWLKGIQFIFFFLWNIH